jgi:hypothetical protein
VLMRTRSGGIAVVVGLAMLGAGCSCQPEPTPPDGGTPVITTLAWPEGAMLEVSATTITSATLRWPAAVGDVTGYRLTIDGQPRELTAMSETLTGLAAGRHLATQVVAFAADGTETTALLAEVAPAEPFAVSDGDISTDFCGANTFLVAPNANIPCEVFSVVIGRVTTSSGSGVPGMRVSVVGHPEWGATTSQADGTFAIGVAAGRLTLQLSSTSFLSMQRTVTALARRFTHVPPTAVLRRDPKATTITTSAGGFHTASPTSDGDGVRTTSVFIPPGSVARLRFADGGTQAAPTLTLRATEAFDSGVNRLTWDAERLNAPYLNNISAVFWPRNTLRGCGEQADAMERWLRSSVQFKDYELSMAGGRTGPAGVFPHQWLVAASKVDNSVLILDPWANEAWETTYFEPSALFEYSNYPKKGGPGLWLGVLGSGGR